MAAHEVCPGQGRQQEEPPGQLCVQRLPAEDCGAGGSCCEGTQPFHLQSHGHARHHGGNRIPCSCCYHWGMGMRCLPACSGSVCVRVSPATSLVLTQGAVGGPLEVGVAAEHEKDTAGAEVADADMADAGDEAEDGVTPQKRKTAPQDVVSCSCSALRCPEMRLPRDIHSILESLSRHARRLSVSTPDAMQPSGEADIASHCVGSKLLSLARHPTALPPWVQQRRSLCDHAGFLCQAAAAAESSALCAEGRRGFRACGGCREGHSPHRRCPGGRGRFRRSSRAQPLHQPPG